MPANVNLLNPPSGADWLPYLWTRSGDVWTATSSGANTYVYSYPTPIAVTPGDEMTLSAYIDATQIAPTATAGVYPPGSLALPSISAWDGGYTFSTCYGGITQDAGKAGIVQTSFIVPAGVTHIVILLDTNFVVIPAGSSVKFSNPSFLVNSPFKNFYRVKGLPYRQPGITYRGGADPNVTPDLDVQSDITMEVVKQDQTHLSWLNASALQSAQWVLNDSGTCKVFLNKYDPGAKNILVNGGVELRVTFHNAINPVTGLPEVWQGLPLRLQRQSSSNNTVDLEGIFSYFKARIVEFASMQYQSIDQIDIAWGLMEMAQTGANYDRGIHASYSPSGVIRSRNYSRDQHQVIYDLVRSFRADRLQNGFDFNFTVDASGNKLFVPAYPYAGTFYAGIVEWGREIIDYNLSDDGTQQATKVWAVGGGSGGVQFEMAYEDVLASQAFGAIVRTFSDGGELDPTWLLQVAQYQTQLRKIAIPNYSILIGYDNNNPLLGKIHPGDFIRVRIDDGPLVQIDQYFRIQSIQWQISPGPALLVQFYQPNLQGYIDPMAELTSLEV